MGLDDIAKGAIALVGIGIIAERFGAGPGLAGLGTGITKLAAAPLGGVGAGLTGFAGGIRSLAESFGDIGRGIGEIFKWLPPQNGYVPSHPPLNGGNGQLITLMQPTPLVTQSGGDQTTQLTGGGGKVPKPIAPTRPHKALQDIPGYFPTSQYTTIKYRGVVMNGSEQVRIT